MKVSGVESRFTGQWIVELQVEPGSVPDRVMPYSRAAVAYRPLRLRLEFRASARVPAGAAALRLENGSGFMKQAAESVWVSSAAIFGPRLKKDGSPGQFVTHETFYNASPRDNSAPEWVRDLIREQIQALGGRDD